MIVALIVIGSVLVAALLVGFIVWAHQYTKVGPNEVLIISGRRQRPGPDGVPVGYRIVRGGGTYVRPFREKVQRLSLELLQFEVRTGETYSMHGVPVQVDGVCMVKVDASDTGIELAAQEFLSRGVDQIARSAQQAVEGHLRSAAGAHSIEDVYRERAKLAVAQLADDRVLVAKVRVDDGRGVLDRVSEGAHRDAFDALGGEELERRVENLLADLGALSLFPFLDTHSRPVW